MALPWACSLGAGVTELKALLWDRAGFKSCLGASLAAPQTACRFQGVGRGHWREAWKGGQEPDTQVQILALTLSSHA